jgi:protein O-mannosyl-transferase
VATTKRKKIRVPRVDSTRSSNPTTTDAGIFNSIPKLSFARILLLICLLSFLGYANSLGGEFVFDDTDQIVENQNIRSWENLQKAFTTHVWAFRDQSGALDTPPPLPYYRPLFTVMLTVEYHLFGLWPQGWHLVSLLLHILCSVSVFYVIRQLSGNPLTALIASALFSVHPVHAESVSWISGMTDPLFGCFFLTSFYFYLKARGEEADPARRRVILLSLGAFVLAVFAKETALSLLVLVFGHQLIGTSGKPSQRFRAAVLRTLPYAAVALIYLVPRYLVLGDLMWKNPQAPQRPLTYTLLTLPFVICSYVYHLLWPIGLSVTYQTSFVTTVTSTSFLIPAALITISVSALVFYRKKISREVWEALLLTFVPLLPVLNLGQVSREEYLVFDHYLYLPVSGLTYLIALAFLRIGVGEPKTSSRQSGRLNRPAVATAGIVVLTLAMIITAALENRPWADSYSLWANVARVRPGYWAGYYNAGLALLDTKRVDEAQSMLEKATTIKGNEPNVFAALGRNYDMQGETTKAVTSFKRALEIDPEMFQSYNDLGAVYFKNKDYSLAEMNFGAALRLRPDTPVSRFNLGLCYAREERYNDAIREFERVIQLMPRDAYALYELGIAYEKLGRMEEARRVMERGQGLAKSEELANKLAESLNKYHESVKQ